MRSILEKPPQGRAGRTRLARPGLADRGNAPAGVAYPGVRQFFENGERSGYYRLTRRYTRRFFAQAASLWPGSTGSSDPYETVDSRS